MSLIPFATGWMGENHFAPITVAAYGVVLLMAGVAFTILSWGLIKYHGRDSPLGVAIGTDHKGKLSLASYAVAIPLAFVNPRVSLAIYVFVAAMWLLPDPRIERVIAE
jgi:uncharacterized membrane protein